MRKRERQIEDSSVLETILRHGKFAVVALCRRNEPYVVTLSYGYDQRDRALYFHCANDGLKSEFARENPDACATIVEDKGYRQGKCSHAYRSVVIRGRIEIIEDHDAKLNGLDVLIRHLEEDPATFIKSRLPALMPRVSAMHIWRLSIDEITGKEGQ